MTNCNLSVISVTESFLLVGLNSFLVMIDLIAVLISLNWLSGDSSLVERCAGGGSVGWPRCCERFRLH